MRGPGSRIILGKGGFNFKIPCQAVAVTVCLFDCVSVSGKEKMEKIGK